MTRLHRPLMTIKLCYTFLYLDHDKFPLLGSSIWPLLPETQIDLIVRSAWCLATLLSYHTCTANKKIYIYKKKMLFHRCSNSFYIAGHTCPP